MFCQKCGKKNKDSARFCYNCGNDLACVEYEDDDDEYEEDDDEYEEEDDDDEYEDDDGGDEYEEDDDDANSNSILSQFEKIEEGLKKVSEWVQSDEFIEQAKANLMAWYEFFEILKEKKQSGEIIMAYSFIDDGDFEGDERVLISSEVAFYEDELKIVFGNKTKVYKKNILNMPIDLVSVECAPHLFGVISNGSLPFEDADGEEYDVGCIIMLSSFSKRDFHENCFEEFGKLKKGFEDGCF